MRRWQTYVDPTDGFGNYLEVKQLTIAFCTDHLHTRSSDDRLVEKYLYVALTRRALCFEVLIIDHNSNVTRKPLYFSDVFGS